MLQGDALMERPMPTKKPRITITLDQPTYETLSRLSTVGGDSMSEIVTGFLAVCVPSMERMVVVMEQANRAPEQAKAGLAAAIAKVEESILPAMALQLDQGDMFLSEVVNAAVTASGRAATTKETVPARSPPSTPGPVTRGSGTPRSYKLPANGAKHGPI